jgi:3-hydroxyethyl bacteriochlorophyllide a dehydrogenase
MILNPTTTAIVFEAPGRLSLSQVGLVAPGGSDCVVDIEWSGISTGTERLLWQGRMPDFPGMGYPLVPGYESVGRVVEAGAATRLHPGQRVFVPGSTGFESVRGLFGGAAARVVAPAERLVPIAEDIAEEGVLLALAATGYHALAVSGQLQLPELIVGHGVLGRLIARLVLALDGPAPTVWEKNPLRRGGADAYRVVDPADDARRDYAVACDVSGSPTIVNDLVAHLARGGRVILGGFYEKPVSFDFPPAFMREIGLQIAAEWRPDDLRQVVSLIESGRLSLAGLITHRESPASAENAYRTAFDDADCLKMILDWRTDI